MNWKLSIRLALDLTAFGLLLIALAYYWLDNAAHEVIGTAMFLLLLTHNLLNRRWYQRVPRKESASKAIDKALVLILLSAMATLLTTSVMISQNLFAAMASPDAFTARRLHLLSAYWAFVMVAIHLGIRWHLILSLIKRMHSFIRPGSGATAACLSATALALVGMYSYQKLDIGGKLFSQMSLEWWDFSESTWGFFFHHLAVVGLFACLAHYAFRWIRGASLR